MRLARKLTLAIVAGMALVLAANAYYRIRRELAAFDVDMQQDHDAIGRALEHAVSLVWQSAGREAALRTLAAVPGSSTLRIAWLDAHEARHRAPSSELLITEVPVFVNGTRQGTIEITESRRFQQQYVRRTVIRSVILTGLAVLSTSALAVAIGVWFVGRPMQKLVEKARQIGAGNLQEPLRIRQRDEIGELADEMNAMCDRLVEARAALSAETQARIRSQEQLRHADRLATVGKLASGVAHELGSPLSVALVRANIIAGNAALPPATRDAGRVVAEQIDRITAIVRHLLAFARGSGSPGGASFKRREPSDLLALAERSVAMLQPLASKRQLTLRIECVGEPPRPPVNALQIEQVLVNLLVNAIQASRALGKVAVVIASRAARPPADLEHTLDPDVAPHPYAVLSVTDEGVGIRPEILPRIFEPFFTTKAVGEGTGLGLSVAYGMVRDHGGWIEVESEPDQGSRFSVYLPTTVAEPSGY